MTIQHLVNSAIEQVVRACKPLYEAVIDLHDSLPLNSHLALSAKYLRGICEDMAASIEEARADHSKMPNLCESLNRLTLKFQSGYAEFTERQNFSGSGRARASQTNAKRYAVAAAFVNFMAAQHQLNENCTTDGEEHGLPKHCPVPDEIKDQAKLLGKVFPEVNNRIEACLEELKVAKTYTQLDPGFKATAEAFISNITCAMSQLATDCNSAYGILESRCRTSKDVITIIGKYETRLKDMMIFYKGISDLINLETSSRQLPPEFLQCVTPYLVKPFEVHNTLQILIVAQLDLLAKGDIGACLSELIELCEELEESNEDFIKDLREIDGHEAPDFVNEFLSDLDSLEGKLAGACQGIRLAAADAQISENPERALIALQQFLTALKDAQEGSFFKLSNDLSEALRLQQILPSWREQANWVARAKLGLKDFWERISDLITRARTCLDEFEVLIEKPKRRRVRVRATDTESTDEVLKEVVLNLDTLGSAAPIEASGGGSYGRASSNIESRISSGIAGIVGVDLKPPHTTDAEVLAFAQKLKATLKKSVVKSSRYGSTVYDLQRGGAVPTGSVSSSQIRGSQATFYKQAVQIRDLVSGLLDKLVCQLNVCDDETIDFFKEDIRANVNDIVAEVGREGGALQQRVDTLLTTMREDLRELEIALGINAPAAQRRDMDIAEREENEENFELLKNSLTDQPSSLQRLLVDQYFPQIANAAGTVLNNLLRTIEAIPASIQEIYSLMDSVRLGEVDRRVTLVTEASTTTVEQLLSWIEISASSDWPSRLGIGDTRRVEVQSVKRTADAQLRLLTDLINNLSNLIQTGVGRVRGALRELQRELTNVSTFAAAIR